MTEEKPAPKQETKPDVESLLALAAMVCFGIALPIFDLLRQQAEFFAVRSNSRLQVVTLALLLAIGLPLLAASLPALLRRKAPRLAHWLFAALFVAATGLVGLTLLRKTPGLESAWPLALLLGAGLYLAQHRFSPVRSFLALLAISLLVAPALFLFDSRVRRSTVASTADLSASGQAEQAVETGPVIFLVFDEWSLGSVLSAEQDQRGRVRKELPNLAQLADDSFWFENPQTVADMTVTAVPAILTGGYPKPNSLPILADYPDNLFTLFAPHADIRAWEPLTRLCPVNINQAASTQTNSSDQSSFRALLNDVGVLYGHLAAPPGLRARLPAIDYRWSGFVEEEPAGEPVGEGDSEASTPEDSRLETLRKLLGGKRVQNFQTFLSAIDQNLLAQQPNQLFFLHSLLPHKPWEHLPSGAMFTIERSLPEGIDNRENWDEDPYVSAQAFQRYLLQVEFLDSLLGDLVEHLKELGWYDRTTIVVTADHGVAFRPDLPRRVAVPENEIDVVPVPILIKAPGQQAGVRVQQPVSVLDLVPTLASLFDLEIGWPTQGRALLERKNGRVELANESSTGAPNTDFLYRAHGRRALARDLHERKQNPWRPQQVGPDPRNPQAIPELFGTATPAKRIGDLKARLASGDDYAAVTIDKEELRYLVGEIEVPPDHQPVQTRADEVSGPQIPSDRLGIAIGVDGRVTATTWAFPPIEGRRSALGDTTEGHYRFSALLADGVLKPGFNDLTLHYAHPKGDGSYELRPTSFATLKGALDAKIEPADATQRWFSLDDEKVPLMAAGKSSGILGFLQLAIEGDGASAAGPPNSGVAPFGTGEPWRIRGWAIDKQTEAPVERVFLFYRGELITSAVPDLPERWVAENHGGESYLDSGFEGLVFRSRAFELERFGVEAIAVSQGRAAKLDTLYPQLREHDGRRILQVGDGRRLELASTSSLRATIDRVAVRNDRLVVVGWAGDPETGRAAEAVAQFRSDEYQTHLRPRLERPELVEGGALPAGLATSGFRFRLAQEDAGALLDGELEFVAISGPGEAGSQAVQVVLDAPSRAALRDLLP